MFAGSDFSCTIAGGFGGRGEGVVAFEVSNTPSSVSSRTSSSPDLALAAAAAAAAAASSSYGRD